MFESFENKQQPENLGNQLDKPKISESEVWSQCESAVQDFYNEGKDLQYENSGLQGRYEIADQFYSDIKETMGVDAGLSFEPMSRSSLGGYNYADNSITLNSNYLESADSTDLLDTILHEARHAYQLKAIDNPNSVSVDDAKIAEWKDSLDYYIEPEWDYEAYTNQPVERDADDFAKGVLAAGYVNSDNYLTNLA